MNHLKFVYEARDASKEDVALFLPGDPFLDERKAEIEARLTGATLDFPERLDWIYPEDYVPTSKDEEAIFSFRRKDWTLLALTFSDAIHSFLLVRKDDVRFALILSFDDLTILKEIHGPLAIADGQESISVEEALELIGHSPLERQSFEPNRRSKPIELRDDPLPEDDEIDEDALREIARPAFESNAKPRSLGSSFSPVEDEEESEPEAIDVASLRPSFTGNAKRKPPKILGRPKRTEAPAKAEEEAKPVDWRALKGDFTPASSASPQTIRETEQDLEKRAMPEEPYVKPTLDKGRFVSSSKPGKIVVPRVLEGAPLPKYEYRNPNSWLYDLYVDDGRNPDFRALEERATAILSRFVFLRFTKATKCVPDLFSADAEIVRPLERFRVEEWKMVACYASGDVIVSGLFLFRANPSFGIVLAINAKEPPKLFAVSTLPISFEDVRADSSQLAYLCQERPLEEEPGANAPAPSFVPEDVPPLEESEPAPIEAEEEPLCLARERQRKIYCTPLFFRSAKRFYESYRGHFAKDCETLLRDLVFSRDEELAALFRATGGKTIRAFASSRPYTVLDFGTSSQYAASRVYLLPGTEIEERKIEKDAYVLLYLAGNDEHDDQSAVVQRLESRLFPAGKGAKELRLHEILFEEETDAPQSVACPSLEQKNLLEGAFSSLPHLFLGSAGTGKTILSFESAVEASKDGDRILYLTYQKELRDYCEGILHAKGMTNVEVCTFQDLCFRLNVPMTKEMRGKRRYREWFFSTVLKNPSLRKAVSSLGGNVDDQCSTCYVFYRGVIGGSILLRDLGKDILPLGTFLEMMRKEEGYSDEQKRVIYDIAVHYEAHLEKHKGTTDNRLARAILSGGEKYRVYDMVIVDEFQDLSELQFQAVCSLLKQTFPLRLLVYGDDNQAINPTLFDSKGARKIVKGFFANQAELHTSELNDSYRSGTNLVRYINLVKRVTKGAIGKRGGGIDEVQEQSCREDDEDVFVTLLEGKGRLPGLLRSVKNSSKDAAILFPSAESRDKARAAFGPSLDQAFVDSSFLSVSDAKGREWDTVVLVDFFSESKALFEAMLGGKKAGKKSTLHRMMFNRYYVALTRAKNRIVVYESDAGPLAQERLLSGLESVKGSQSLEEYLGGSLPDERWFEEGDRRLKAREYEEARQAYSRASETKEREEKIARVNALLAASGGMLSEKEAISVFLGYRALDDLASFYRDNGHAEKVALLRSIRKGRFDVVKEANALLSLAEEMNEEEMVFFASLLLPKFTERLKQLQKKGTAHHGQ